MIYIGQFDETSVVTWTAERPKCPNLSHLQGAMFLDRPDLWPVRPRRRKPGTRPLNGQTAFSFFTDQLPQCAGPNCPRNQTKKKGAKSCQKRRAKPKQKKPT